MDIFNSMVTQLKDDKQKTRETTDLRRQNLGDVIGSCEDFDEWAGKALLRGIKGDEIKELWDEYWSDIVEEQRENEMMDNL